MAVASKENEPSPARPGRDARAQGAFAMARELFSRGKNARAMASQKATRQSEKSHFSLGNAFFLQ
jgi:hypothetical protein